MEKGHSYDHNSLSYQRNVPFCIPKTARLTPEKTCLKRVKHPFAPRIHTPYVQQKGIRRLPASLSPFSTGTPVLSYFCFHGSFAFILKKTMASNINNYSQVRSAKATSSQRTNVLTLDSGHCPSNSVTAGMTPGNFPDSFHCLDTRYSLKCHLLSPIPFTYLARHIKNRTPDTTNTAEAEI